MNPLSIGLTASAWLVLLCAVGKQEIGKVLSDFRDGLASHDKRRAADWSPYGGKLAVTPAPQVIVERRASDPWARTRAEIQALPEIEPFRWIS